MWKFQGSTEKEVEFPGLIKKTSFCISISIGIYKGCTYFSGIRQDNALFCPEYPKLSDKPKIFRVFFQKRKPLNPKA